MNEVQALRADYDNLGARIAALEAKQAMRSIALPARAIALRDGEQWAGMVLNSDGTPSYDLILLPAEEEDITWENAMKWAESLGGDLPDRNEQALLYANLKDSFAGAWYWSKAQHVSDSDYAWAQHFGNGYQLSYHKGYKLRARAVRRLAI